MLRVNPKDSKLRESSSSAVRLVREPYHQGAMIFTLADLYPFPCDNHQGFRDLQDGLNPRIGLTDGNVAIVIGINADYNFSHSILLAADRSGKRLRLPANGVK
jgi:hypothetical protein